jgi:hypothetical protein
VGECAKSNIDPRSRLVCSSEGQITEAECLGSHESRDAQSELSQVSDGLAGWRILAFTCLLGRSLPVCSLLVCL